MSAKRAILSVSTSGLGTVYFNGVQVATASTWAFFLTKLGWPWNLVARGGTVYSSSKCAHNEQPGAFRWAMMVTLFAIDGTTYLPIETDPTRQEKGLIVRGREP